MSESSGDPGLSVAIIGMAVRFPGAPDVETFWRNLRGGVESITFFSEEELRALGVDPATARTPGYIRAGAVLERPARFDAGFFGYSPRDAELLDPQHRIFLECAWKALESAGQAPGQQEKVTGIFAGTSLSSYLLFNLLTRPEIQAADDTFPVMVANDKDFLATRVAYHLNLKGPAITLQTGCSTSLVATHLACQHLLGFQCDVALAGGVSLHVPQRTGYVYQEGGITSADGHTRTFDADGKGTVFGSGAGVVVLKRLEDALADGDTIHAVIRGSAVNNDGAVKVGFTAPGVEGQAEVIARAQAIAEVPPETIQYVEAHGTATPLGDPIEVSALTQAFRAGTDRKGFCGLGSVKSNLGHLDAAAGVAGLIKTTLALAHRELPPTLNFRTPNPRLELEGSPFYVNAALQPWPRAGTPRRAGVSSFGIGGTNAHLILEEAPAVSPAKATARPWELLLLSAKTPTALEAQTDALRAHVAAHPEQALTDVAYTLQVGRKGLEHRRAVICTDREDALRTLEARDPQRLFTLAPGSSAPPVVFMFAGGGAQYVGMGRGLYTREPVFRDAVDRCCALLQPKLGLDLRTVILPKPEEEAAAQQRITRTSVALPALFTVEYAMAQLWKSWGVEPEAMIGHSLGEYAAACLAGVFSLEDALSLVVLRGKLFEELPAGAMLSLALPEDEVRGLLDGQLSIAAVNGPAQVAVAGSTAAIDALAKELVRREMEHRVIPIDVAAHSHLVEPILARFEAFVATLQRHAPKLPFVSNVTGQWITDEEATSPAYWARHLRQTVRFGDGIRTLREDPRRLFLEVSPGRTLSTLARLHPGGKPPTVLSSIRHPQDKLDDAEHLTTTVGRLWASGVDVDWAALHPAGSRRRIPLPTYPFEGKDYWLAPEAPRSRRRGVARKQADVAGWFYLQSWQRAPLPPPRRTAEAAVPACWLVLLDPLGVGAALAERLGALGNEVFTAAPGSGFAREDERRYTIDPRQRGDYVALLADLKARAKPVTRVAHLLSVTGAASPFAGDRFTTAQALGFHSLLALGQALAEQDPAIPAEVWAIADGAFEVESAELGSPEKATLLAACKVLPQEYESLLCRFVDLGLTPSPSAGVTERLARELTSGATDPVVAYRGSQRLVQGFDPYRLEDDAAPARAFKARGVYLITGGLGGVGLHLAEHLARSHQARLALVGRTSLPPRAEWERWLSRDEKDPTRRRIRAVQAMEAAGAEVLTLAADVADGARLREVLAEVDARFGGLDGVIHAAGLAGEQAVALVPGIEPATFSAHTQAKVHGVHALERALDGRTLDFCLLISSNASVLGGLGLGAYSAANLYLDAFAASRARDPRLRWLSASWDGWPTEPSGAAVQTSIDQFAMTAAESVDAFRRAAESGLTGALTVSTGDLDARLAQWVRREPTAAKRPGEGAGGLHARPALGTEYVAPESDLERTIVQVWQELLGLEQLGIYDNFFDLGGNSLIWLKAVGKLKKALGREIPLTAVFEGPTAGALAKVLGGGAAAAQGPAYEASQSRGEKRRERRNRRDREP